MKTSTTFALACLAIAASGAAFATPINTSGANGEQTLQQVLNGVTCTTASGSCTTGGTSSVNVVTDQYAPDELWQLGATGISASQIVIELAGYASINGFGVYDALNPNNRVELFAGAAGAGAQVIFSLDDSGNAYRNFGATGVTFADNLFGFYLSTPDGIWFSQQNLNRDGADHMIAYQGQGDRVKVGNSFAGPWTSGEFVLAWEDLASNAWDYDYNDFVVMVESVQGVPEPGTLALFGMGLAALGMARRRKALA